MNRWVAYRSAPLLDIYTSVCAPATLRVLDTIMKEFRDRVAVVTGAASGIGRALADKFASEGMKVVLADIEEPALSAAAGELTAAGATVLPMVVDVSRSEQVEELADRVYGAFGAVHVLCNNAGVSGGGLSWTVPVDEWQWVLGVNLWGVIHGLRSFLPRMLAAGDEGHIVNTASVAGLVASPGMGPYNVSKFGVVALSETVHHELELMGARVKISALCPAWVSTKIVDADRNRPASLGSPSAPDPSFESLRETVRGLVASGLPPSKVAELVIDAIRSERLYVLTHPEFTPIVRVRMEALLAQRNPSFTGFPR
jgi:NAD(P)-dependent dehydrogenase (short-subunit alcohol dehydrogenase family)